MEISTLVQNQIEAIKSFYSLELTKNDAAFLYLGYSSILFRLKDFIMAFDPGKSIGQSEISVIDQLDLLLYTHNHWDHYNNEKALKIIKQTGTHVIADIISSEELKTNVPPNKITVGDTGSSSKSYKIDGGL